MAVANLYDPHFYDSLGGIIKRPPSRLGGAGLVSFNGRVPVTAGDDIGSQYRLFRAVTPDLIPVIFDVFSDALTSATSFDIGLYHADLGGVISVACLAAALDLHLATVRKTAKDGLNAITTDLFYQSLAEIVGLDPQKVPTGGFDIVATSNVAPTASGYITGLLICQSPAG